jgi:hypothetical protein
MPWQRWVIHCLPGETDENPKDLRIVGTGWDAEIWTGTSWIQWNVIAASATWWSVQTWCIYVIKSLKNCWYKLPYLLCLPGSVQKIHILRAASTLIAGEPEGPSVKTDIPGPKSKQLLDDLSAIQVKYNTNLICLEPIVCLGFSIDYVWKLINCNCVILAK